MSLLKIFFVPFFNGLLTAFRYVLGTLYKSFIKPLLHLIMIADILWL